MPISLGESTFLLNIERRAFMRPNSNICRALKGTRLEEHSYPGDEAMNALEDRIEKERTIPLQKKVLYCWGTKWSALLGLKTYQD